MLVFISRFRAFEDYFSGQGPTAAEGNSGSTQFAFTLTAARVFPYAVSFDYATEDGTATAGVDYTTTSGTGVLPAGHTQVSINVPVLGDTDVESDETFSMRFRNFRAT
jgi:hypothetical protein